MRYLALSHPWGSIRKHRHFMTTADKVTLFADSINEDELPQNYHDAIHITRALGISYIWIDSICICQASDADNGDFTEEAEHMESIFSSAYCVLAASTGSGMSDGFLNERVQSNVVALVSKTDNNIYYVSDVADDFVTDVEQSFLSRRGWAFQERAIARRTIYFTQNQTYFECGKGIRCETLSKLGRCALYPKPEVEY